MCDSVLVFKGFVSQSGHGRTKGASMDHTQLARDYYARRLRAEGATTAVLRLINYHCHSFTFAIRRVRVPNIVPYKASWFADHLCVNGLAITPLLQRHTSSVTERKIGEKRAEGRERRNQIQTHDPNFHSIVPAFRYTIDLQSANGCCESCWSSEQKNSQRRTRGNFKRIW